MNKLNLPDFVPEELKQRLEADADFVLKFRELAETMPNWRELTRQQQEDLARSQVNA